VLSVSPGAGFQAVVPRETTPSRRKDPGQGVVWAMWGGFGKLVGSASGLALGTDAVLRRGIDGRLSDDPGSAVDDHGLTGRDSRQLLVDIDVHELPGRTGGVHLALVADGIRRVLGHLCDVFAERGARRQRVGVAA